ncbi:hypothetical protein N9U62_00035 [Candidatus Pelagibacter sp.]|nr:hypothetical protein [Candidatus Pelagibacter sp.]|tara:strand:- start:1171 stop:1635 length:465 start_codon:yes stop_codon:yes gene_type:complete
MKNNLKTIFAFFCIIILNNCGYAPLLDSKKINFYINDLNVSGDRQLVNLLTNKLEKFKNFNENAKEYNLDISNNYEKVMVNKDSSGNPKNYNVVITTNVNIILKNQTKIEKIFVRKKSFEAQDRKIKEKEMEKKFKKDLAELIGEDIVFFLMSQ